MSNQTSDPFLVPSIDQHQDCIASYAELSSFAPEGAKSSLGNIVGQSSRKEGVQQRSI